MEARKAPRPTAQKVGDIAGSILRRFRPQHGKQIDALRSAWAACVPPALSAHTRVVSFSNGKLLVDVDSPAALAQIDGFMKPQILDCLKKNCPDVNFSSLQLRHSVSSGRAN
ncbi:MAG: DUF721 domain-containing protein [Planctomycetota bacterium]|nr:DUF721 domain-containing protein [Planctomycetota bacterium]